MASNAVGIIAKINYTITRNVDEHGTFMLCNPVQINAAILATDILVNPDTAEDAAPYTDGSTTFTMTQSVFRKP